MSPFEIESLHYKPTALNSPKKFDKYFGLEIMYLVELYMEASHVELI